MDNCTSTESSLNHRWWSENQEKTESKRHIVQIHSNSITTIPTTENTSELFKGYYPSIKNRSTNLKTSHTNFIQNLFYSLTRKENLRITKSLDINFATFSVKQKLKISPFQRSFYPLKRVLPCLFLVLHKPYSSYISPYSINTVFTVQYNIEFVKFLCIFMLKIDAIANHPKLKIS